MKIAFLLPDLDIGGGNSVVLAHACSAAAADHEVTVVLTQTEPSAIDIFPAEGLRVASLLHGSDMEFDVAIASWWQDTLLLPRVSASKHAVLVQGMEDRFYRPNDPRRSLVQEVYRVPLPGITVSHWLRDRLRADYERSVVVVPNGIDKSIFRPQGRIVAPRSGNCRVLVEGPLGSWQKNVVPALRLARSFSEETWLLTSTEVGAISGVDRVFSRIPPSETAVVYRSCDILVKLSLNEGFGLPPLEMFHCGGTVVGFDGPSTGITEYAEHGHNALLARAPDLKVAGEHLAALLEDPRLLNTLKSGALETARAWPSQSEAGSLFVDALESLMQSQPATDADVLNRLESLSLSARHPTPRALNRMRPRIGRHRLVRSIRHSIEVRRPTIGAI